MKELLFNSDNSIQGFILRLTIGIVMFPHGAQKLLGWYGGYGFKGTMEFFTNTLKFSWIISFMVIVIEFICPIFLMLGFVSRFNAFLLLIIMTGAIYTTNFKNGFFMNWFGNQTGEGYEYHLLIIGICIALIFSGSGRFSIDNLMRP